MEGKVVTGMLAVAGVVLLGISVFALGRQDREAPVITFGENELTYQAENSFDSLLEDVKAKDNKDKDISDKVFVDRVIETTDGQHAVVIYGVMDSSNNVATAKRTVKYKTDSQKEQEKSETKDKESKEDAAEETIDQNKQQDSDKGELVPNGKSPAIRLTANEAIIKKGDSFDALSYVENIVDDSDSREELYKHIHIDGKYSSKKVGTYTMKYYATDRHGNASNIETFTLTVK